MDGRGVKARKSEEMSRGKSPNYYLLLEKKPVIFSCINTSILWGAVEGIYPGDWSAWGHDLGFWGGDTSGSRGQGG